MNTDKQFLEEYKLLCDKYGKYIDSCGCCKSPWVCDGDPEDIQKNVEHLGIDVED